MRIKLKPMIFFEIALILLLFQQGIFPSELTAITLILSIIIGMIFIGVNGRIFMNPFLYSSALFILYAIFVSIMGHKTGNVETRLLLITLQWISSICIYNYMMRVSNVERFLLIYIIVAIVSLSVIIILLGGDVVASRLGHNGSGAIVSYYIWGHPIYKSSNGTANICAIASLFLLYLAEKYSNKICYFGVVFLTVGLVLSGSRKGLLLYFIFLIYAIFFMRKGVTVKKLIALIAAPLIIYIVFMKIPIVYDTIGVRIQSLIANFFNQANTLDGNSYLMRANLRKTALTWISNNPFWGYGLNTFQNSLGYGTENNILQIMVEFGLVGTIIYYSFLIPLLWRIVKTKSKTTLFTCSCIIVLSILMQDYGSVTYSWQSMTMWYSICWAIMNRETDIYKAKFMFKKLGLNL